MRTAIAVALVAAPLAACSEFRLENWQLSDKIAAVAIVVGFLQFVALIVTFLIMARTARRQLRAYVSADTCAVSDAAGKEIPNKIGISVRNAGQTPAHDLRSWVATGLHEFPLRDPLGRLSEDHPMVASVLNPGDHKTLIVDWPTYSVDPAEVNAGTVAVYLWGEILYKDVFGYRRHTTFRFFQDLKTAKLQRWANYKSGNEAT